MDGAHFEAIRQFVFAGLPTTTTLHVFFAYFSKASPWILNIFALAFNKSFLSMPSLLGIAPTRIATSIFAKASLSSEVATIAKCKKIFFKLCAQNYDSYQGQNMTAFFGRVR